MGVLGLILIIYLTKDDLKQIHKLQKLEFKAIVYISIIFTFTQIINAFRLKYLTEIFNVKQSNIKWIALIYIRSFANYIPTAGIIHNAMYLKNNSNLPYAKYVSVLLVNQVLALFTAGLIGVIVVLVKYLLVSSFDITMFVVSLVLLSIILISHLNINTTQKNLISTIISNIKSGWKILFSRKKTIFIAIFCHLAIMGLLPLKFHILLGNLVMMSAYIRYFIFQLSYL